MRRASMFATSIPRGLNLTPPAFRSAAPFRRITRTGRRRRRAICSAAHPSPTPFTFAYAGPVANIIALYSDVIFRPLVQTMPWIAGVENVTYFSALLLAFLAIPILDRISGRTPAVSDPLEETDGRYRWALYGYIPFHLFFGVALGLMTNGGLAITVEHELIHGTTKFEAFLVDLIGVIYCYMHYASSHIAHHMKVGTYDDAGTGRMNETIYAFLPRAVYMSKTSSDHSSDSCGNRGRRMLSRIWKWIFSPILVFSATRLAFGTEGLILMCMNSILGVGLLEVVNYVQHYGIVRRTIDGKLEAVSPVHAWNGDWGWTDHFTFNLERHAHHHTRSTLPYQKLKSLPDAPLLPTSYPWMILAAFIPPLFFHIMNPRVLQLQTSMSNKDVSYDTIGG